MENMENNFYEQERRLEQGAVAGESLGRYTAKTFLLMFLGLMVTFLTAIFFTETRRGYLLVVKAFTLIPAFHLVLMIAELVVVLGMTAFLHKISTGTATLFFFVYSALTGVTFAVIFLSYDLVTLLLVFAATSLYFGGMAVFGFVTHIDLSRMRSVLVGGLIFLILMNLLMFFIPGLAVADQILCTLGVILFLAYTAYDTQKIRSFYAAYQGDEIMLKKASIFSALQLYLDFINMFLYLLRIFGKRSRN
jgi:FtsH-binding integral membrane protein